MKQYGDLDVRLGRVSINDFVKQLAGVPGTGWRRNRELEERSRGTSPMFCFSYEDGTELLPAATLWLVGREGMARVANIIPVTQSTLSRDEYNGLLRSFYDKVITPVITDLGAEATLSKTELSLDDILSEDTEGRLRSFSSNANKSTGSSHPYDKKRWFDFIISHYRHGENMPTDVLVDWLVEDGWNEDQALDLVIEFERGIALLRQYNEDQV